LKIVVLGAGALGSIAAAHLARAGADVALIARGPRAKLLAERGVTVTGLSDFTAKLPIIERPQELEACDAFMLSAKTYDTQSALDGVGNLKAGMAFSVQNGVVKNEHLAAVFGWEHTLGCIANFSGEVQEDGSVHFTRNEGLYIGELDPGDSRRVHQLAQVLNEAGIKTIVPYDIRSVEWSKYATWMGLTAVAVLSRLYTHVLYQDEDLDVLQTTLTREAVALARAEGIEVTDLGGLIFPKTMASAPTEECVAVLKKAGAAMEAGGTLTHRMSALQDLLRGRRLEVEETFGYAVKRAAELGVAAPGLETCYRLLAGINRSQTPSP
jgi:2-dehydropantoate 2-reductase